MYYKFCFIHQLVHTGCQVRYTEAEVWQGEYEKVAMCTYIYYSLM